MWGALLGIEIGNNTIKIVQVKKKGKSIIVTQYGMVPTPKGAIDDGNIVDMVMLCTVIQKLLEEKQFKINNAAVLIQGTGIIIREAQIPIIPQKEIAKIVEFKKEEYFPIDVTDYRIDFKVMDEVETEEGKKQNIMLIAVPNQMVESYVQLLKRLNLKPTVIDIAPNAVCKMFTSLSMKAGQNESYAIMVLDIGDKTVTVTILSSGHILFNRSLLYGFGEMNNIITNQFGSTNLEHTEQFKKKYGAIYENEDALEEDFYGTYISHIIKPSIDYNMLEEIQQFLDFYYSRENSEKIEAVYLIGGGAYLRNLDQYISNYLNIPTFIGDNIPICIHKKVVGFEENILQYVNVLGLVNRM